MEPFSRVLYCADCGKVQAYPVCCGKEMELDGDTFFCNVCGKEKPLDKCCNKKMMIIDKEKIGGVFT